ncbi:MAG: TonB-dependent receptor [Planctomycetota bacterium]
MTKYLTSTGIVLVLIANFAGASEEEADKSTPAEDAAERYLQENPGGDGETKTYRMKTDTVIGSAQNVRSLASSADFIDAETLRELNLDDVNRALRRVPGVYVREEDGFGLLPNISIRGVDSTRSSKITMMEDGILTAPAPYSAPSAYYAPTAGRMSGIEVLKGSSQILYGPHITGGVINYLSTPIPQKASGYLRTTYGTNNEVRVHAWYGDTIDTASGRWGFLVEGYYRSTDGFHMIDTEPDFTSSLADDTGFTKTEPMLKVSWEPKSQTYQRLEAKAGHSELDANISYLGLEENDFRNSPFRRYSSSRFDNLTSRQTRTYLKYLVVPDDDVEIEAAGYYNQFKRNWFKLNDIRDVEDATDPNNTVNMDLSSALAGANGGNGLDVLRGDAAGTLRVRNNNRSYYMWGAQVLGTWRLHGEGVQHEVKAGVRYHEDRVRRFQTNELFEQASNGAIIDHDPGTPGDAGDREQMTGAIALYAQDRITTGKWTVTPGIRFESLDLEHIDNDAPATSGTESMSLVGGGLNALYRDSPAWEFFGGVNRGFSPPSPRAAIKDDVTEETSLGFELGTLYHNSDDSIGLTAIVFYTQFDDLIVVDNIGGAGSGDTENVGKVDSKGLELKLDYRLDKKMGWNFVNHWWFAGTYTDATLDGDSNSTDPESIFAGGLDGNRVPYIPEFQFQIGTRFAWKRTGFSLTGTFVDSTYTTASNTSSQTTPDGAPDARFGQTDSYFVVDLAAWYRLKENVTLLAGIQNLLDDEYLSSRHPHGPRAGKPLYAYFGLEFLF